MAPLKPVNRVISGTTRANQKPLAVSTRSRSSTNTQIRSKRKADFSPVKENVKRTAMGDITNNKKNEDKRKPTMKQPVKKAIVQTKTLPSVKTVVKPKQNENISIPQAPCINGVVTRAAVKNVTTNQTAVKPKETHKEISNVTRIKTRLSNEFEKTEESLYSSALEEL